MGEVYRATDRNPQGPSPSKCFLAHSRSMPSAWGGFQRETEGLASLNHPNIAAIYGLERADGTTALVMELVEGPTLADRIFQGPVPGAAGMTAVGAG